MVAIAAMAKACGYELTYELKKESSYSFVHISKALHDVYIAIGDIINGRVDSR